MMMRGRREWLKNLVVLCCVWLGMMGVTLAEEIPVDAQLILLDTQHVATIKAQELSWFRFVPTETATYEFYSSSKEDTYGYLYQVTGTELELLLSDDDSGAGNNFSIRYMLKEGSEYYFGVRYFNQETAGTYPVQIEKYTGLVAQSFGESYFFDRELGDTVTFTVIASSQRGKINYQWVRVNEYGLYETIDGETTNEYNVIVSSESSRYACVVSDGDSTESLEFYVSSGYDNVEASAVGDTSLTVKPGEFKDLEVKATSSSGVLTYRWRKTWDDQDGYHEEYLVEETGNSLHLQVERNFTIICEVSSSTNFENVYFNLYVNAPVVIEPEGESSFTVERGGSAKMSVIATTDARTLQYQWRRMKSNDPFSGYEEIQGATEASYTAKDITEGMYYTCDVTNELGFYASQTFYIYVDGDFQASSGMYYSADPGDEVLLNTWVSGGSEADTFEYQWYYPVQSMQATPQPIPNATDSEYKIENADHTGYYLCRVTNSTGVVKDVWCLLTIQNELSIDSFEQTEYVMADEEVTLCVEATASTGDLFYQWYKADDYSNSLEKAQVIEGAVDSSYTASGFQSRYNHYLVQIMDAFGNTTIAQRNVYAEDLLSLERDGEYDHYADYGDTITLHVEASHLMQNDLVFTWYKITREWDDSGWREVRQLIEGANSSTLIVENARETAYYQCDVASAADCSGSIDFNVKINDEISIAVDENISLYVMPGAEKELIVLANTPHGDLHYQWYQDIHDNYGHTTGIPISGVTQSSYITPALISPGGYFCRIEDDFQNEKYVYFQIYIDNQLTITRVGEEIRTVEFNDDLDLQVEADCLEGEITYYWSFNGMEIAGADKNSVTLKNVSSHGSVYCQVTDKYENITSTWFEIYIDNHLSASAVDQSYFQVEPGEMVTMQVIASAKHGELFYQWYGQDGVAIEGAEESSFSRNIDKASQYRCDVKDEYGNFSNVWFYITINNDMVVTAEGGSDVQVRPGECAELKVNATARNGELMYQWYAWQQNSYGYADWVEIEGATSNNYVTNPIEHRTNYYCRVLDIYDNFADQQFEINIDNSLTLEANSESNLKVKPGEIVNLQVSSYAEKGTVSLQWYKIEKTNDGNYQIEIPGANSEVYETEAIQGYTEYICTASDMYGNSISIRLTVSVENHLTASWSSDTYTYIRPGESAILKVDASCDEGNLTYAWYKSRGNGPARDIIDGANEDVITIDSSDGSRGYYCYVSDKFGNTEQIWFSIIIDSGLAFDSMESSDVVVRPGEKATLRVETHVDQGEVTYQWYKVESDNTFVGPRGDVIPGATSSTYETEEIYSYTKYRCIASDQYGNQISTIFTVRIENNLIVFIDEESYTRVKPGEAAVLKVKGSADEGELNYTWYKFSANGPGSSPYELFESDIGDTYVTEPVYSNTGIYCTVNDIYGNTESVFFEIKLDNGFYIEAVGSNILKIKAGESVTLKVEGHADQGEITYQWYQLTLMNEEDEGYYYSEELIAGATDAEYQTEALEESFVYRCVAEDMYGELSNVFFSVDVGNFSSLTLLQGQTIIISPLEGYTSMEIEGSSVQTNGLTVSAVETGTTVLEFHYSNESIVQYRIDVVEGSVMKLPAGMRTIEEEAFYGDTSIEFVELGEEVESVQKNAFAFTAIRQIVINGQYTILDENAFGKAQPIILCHAGSKAEEFARKFKYSYLYIP